MLAAGRPFTMVTNPACKFSNRDSHTFFPFRNCLTNSGRLAYTSNRSSTLTRMIAHVVDICRPVFMTSYTLPFKRSAIMSLTNRLPLVSACLLALVVAGCTTPTTSNTARTSIEQLLISNAVDQSLSKIDFRPFQGSAVHLSETYMDSVDKPYVIGSVRHRLLTAGARLVDKAEEADIVVELRSGGIGTHNAESYIGIPEIALPGLVTLPEVKLVTRNTQSGTAKLGMVAYDAKTREVLGSGGTTLSESNDNNWFIAGVGPFQEGSVKQEISRSTTGNAAYVRNTLPPQVAFAPRQSSVDAEEIQFTAGEQPATE